MGQAVRAVLALALTAVLAFSIYQIAEIQSQYAAAGRVREETLPYKPAPAVSETAPGPVLTDETEEALPVVNQSIIDAQNEINGDIVGWLSIPGTAVDYMFAQAGDNSFYLDRDLKKHSASAGSIFMDCRNDKTFSDFNTILYGHHMKNGSMFQSLRKFGEGDFFDNCPAGLLYLARATYTLRFFAYMVVRSDDAEIYGTLTPDAAGRDGYFAYVREKAGHYREIGLTDQDRVVTLSTCSYEFDEARIVVLARLERQK